MDNLAKDQVYNILDEAEAQQEKGYSESDVGHQFEAEQHRRIITVNQSDPGTSFSEATKMLERQTLKMRKAIDSAELLGKTSMQMLEANQELSDQLDVTGMEKLSASYRMAAQQQLAMAEPDKAAAVAVVEANAPLSVPEPTKTAMGFHEYQLGSMAKSFQDKRWVWSFDSWAADIGSMMINPVRNTFGQGRAGMLLSGGKTGYFKLVDEWHAQPLGVQEANWDELNTLLVEAAGGNDLVYASLVYPLIYPQERYMPYVDAALDILDTGTTLASLAIVRRLRNKITWRARALAMGNEKEAGKATVEAVAKGDPAAVVEGHPLKGAAPTEEVTGLEVPTKVSFEDDLVAQGRLDTGESLVGKKPGLTPEEIAQRKEFVRSNVLKDGRIVADTSDSTKIEFTVEQILPYNVRMHVTDLAATLANLKKLRANAKADIKLLVADTKAGEKSSEIVNLTEVIKTVRAKEKELAAAIAKGDSTATVDGLPIGYSKRKRTVSISYTEDDVGRPAWRETHLGLYTQFFGTPEAGIGKIMDNLVSTGTNMRQQQRRVFGYFDKQIKKIRRNLNSASEELVHNVLLTGDRLQHVYTDAELLEGIKIDNVGYLRLTEKEVEGYKATRRMFDDLYVMTDRMQLEELRFGGYKMYYGKLLDETGKVTKDVRVFPKVNELHWSIPRNRFGTQIARVIDLRKGLSEGMPVDLSRISDLDDGLTQRKWAFARLKNKITQGDDSVYSWGLVDTEAFGDLNVAKYALDPDHVLDYRPGYVPKLAQENIRFVVENPTTLHRDGVKVNDSVILRGFESEAEADIYLAQLRAKGKTGPVKTEVGVKFRENPNNKEKVDFLDNRLFRGAFTGNRHENGRFRIGLDGKEATRVSAFDALQRYADFVAAYTPMHEFKQATIRRFLNQGKNYLANPTRWDSKLEGASDEVSRLKAMQDWMKAVFAVPTTDEMVMAKMSETLANTLSRVIWNIPKGTQRVGTEKLRGLHHWVVSSKSAADPVAALKSATFDLMLGAFNPAQYFVQSAGMFIPSTLHPLQAAATMPEFLFLRYGFHATDYKSASKAAKSMGLNSKKMETMLHAFHRSGIPDSILENADFGHYAGTHGAYYSHSMLNTVRDKSRFFYNAGELNNRTFAFVMAFNRKAKDKGWDLTKKLSDAQLEEVVKEALRLGTNMTAGNKAKWQDGILGLPTQFWQQTHKYYENLVYGLSNASPTLKRKLNMTKENEWTLVESMSALFMNALMFGAAGYGLDDWMKDLDRNMIGDMKLDPEKDRMYMAYLRGGLLEMLSFTGLGFELDIADRVGPASGSAVVWDKWIKPVGESFMDGKLGAAVGTALLGASGSMLTRSGRAMSEYWRQMSSDAHALDWDEGSILETAKAVASLSSTGSNVISAMTWRAANDLLTAQGTRLYIIDDGEKLPISVAVAKAMGFDPLAKEKMETLKRLDQLRDKDKADLARALTNEYRTLLQDQEMGVAPGSPVVKATMRRIAFLKYNLVEDFGQGTSDEIMATVRRTLDTEVGDSMNPFEKKLFNAIQGATPYSELEKNVMAEFEAAREFAKIKRDNTDAE